MTDPLDPAKTSDAGPEAVAPSPSASAAKASPTPAPPPLPPSPGLLQRLWTLVVRLLILGMSISVGWIAGLVVAQVWPSRNPTPPIQERVMRQTSQTVRKVRQFPQWWQGADSAVAPVANTTAPEPTTGIQSEPPGGIVPASPLSQEVATLQQDLASLETRLTALEQQVGQPGEGDLADRLQQLAQQAAISPDATPSPNPTEETSPLPDAAAEANPNGESAAETTTDPPPSTTPGLGRHAAAPFTEPAFPLVSDRIGLPSALLFRPESSLLTPAGSQLLDAVVPDLRRAGSGTFLVGSHTDGDLSAEEARQITFQQALAIQTYLAAQLEDTNSRWIVVGYGKTRPVAVGDAPGTEARNQRIEIGIVRP